ncbi:MAG: cytochrome c3 family protein [Candidatus Marinimicrobia bacterium]|nr:cytochrome c3 family protein [Candidatus Neomarinimicrobiota bacterium]MCF7828489.1 cytochrome c3 family protein [Candidatus Neomarinimicrobiota bacterium]MCF7881979.1 cytochrome c3 family protein [Candidatus Neomarinimicrobiota bacterium]
MKRILIVTVLSLLFVSIASGQQEEEINTCADCHEMMGAPYDSIVHAQSQDIHAQKDVTCADCHGGDPTTMDFEAAKAPETRFRGKPDPAEIPDLCGSCHADPEYMRQFDPGLAVDQLAKYWTSRHGEKLREGDAKVAECASCHGAHGVLPVDDPRSPVYPTRVPETCNTCHGNSQYMAEYNIPTDQYEEFAGSVHGQALLENKDIGAPACNDCHGNHGATPPGIVSISRVCGTCHINNMDLFQESKHEPIFDMMDLPECETCHGNHGVQHPTDAMIGTGEESVCLNCHGEGDSGYKMAAAMSESIDSLKMVYDSAEVMIQRAEEKDMGVSDLEYSLREVRQSLIQTRTMIHSFDVSRVEEIENEGLSVGQEIIRSARELIDEFYYRRKGLGIFTLVITLVVIALYLKIRHMEQQKPSD